MMAAAKQNRDEESLMRAMGETYVIKSMRPDGDCGYELMCKWKAIYAQRKRGHDLSENIIDEPVPVEEIVAMRSVITDEQERQVLQKNNATLKTMIAQSMFDWWHSPLDNNGRNDEVAGAIKARPAGMPETEWLESYQCLSLHSSLIRTGRNEVFAESPEMEAFSLMIGAPLAIYLPGHCEMYPQSKYCKYDKEPLIGICNGNHYYLAVPKQWIIGQEGHTRGIKRALLFLKCKVNNYCSRSEPY